MDTKPDSRASTGEEKRSILPAKRWQQGALALLATLIVGAAGSGLWELLFKPGLTTAGRAILAVATLGSSAARDWAYQSAALDPTAIPSLLLVIGLWLVPASMLLVVIPARWFRRYRDRRIAQAIDPALPEAEQRRAIRRSLDRFVNRLYWVSIILLTLSAGQGVVGAMIVNQSVLIWRAFNADMKICAPHISDREFKVLVAQFASVKKRSDYVKLNAELQRIARTAGVKLTETPLW